ncbi:hypothetical protein SaccyDRAFT_4774 [Saccharomonospora cyanea NA-134]|uniref:Uncharacterized protein n=1 Tax=Saccharomonospora cyanea NA-134 TaxID=882082 RepID=H5XL71_9PSEU|nr:hypothetical protein SaccyDRAFT_4774 [Saccharomonospora cyanea NA-134]
MSHTDGADALDQRYGRAVPRTKRLRHVMVTYHPGGPAVH